MKLIRDNCIQIFQSGGYIIGCNVENFVLQLHVSWAVKHNFQTYIQQYTSPKKNFEYGYPHSNVLNFKTLKARH